MDSTSEVDLLLGMESWLLMEIIRSVLVRVTGW